MKKRKRRRLFILERYVEVVAWRSFCKNRDPALGWEDFLQEARIAVWRASQKFDGSLGFKYRTYVVTAVINAMRQLFRRSHNYDVDASWQRLVFPYHFFDFVPENDFRLAVLYFFRGARLSPGAKRVVSGIATLKVTTLEGLRKGLRMSCFEFERACLELKDKFQTI